MAILDDVQSPLSEKDVSIWANVKKWGLISALVGIVFQLLNQISGIMNQSGVVIGLYTALSFGVSIALYVFALREHRDQELDGFMTFKRAFYLAFMIGLLSTVIVLIFNYIYMNFISPSAMDAQLETTRTMMEKFGMPEDKLDEAIEKQRQSLSSPLSIVTGLFGAGIVVAILSLIVAAIMKKERPMFGK
ncbi:MAG: DUF4199 domain-containing protein [Saprospiraceae bacterium]|nr:DUF4199 domain-containing protein [Saprospiraceae bacterium]